MLVNLVFDGHARNVANLPLDVFVSFSVACLTEFPADVFLVLTLDRWGRRWLAFATMILSGIFSLISAGVPIGNIHLHLFLSSPYKILEYVFSFDLFSYLSLMDKTK